MGKFLYGKRKNLLFNPNKKVNNTSNPISRYYTKDELAD